MNSIRKAIVTGGAGFIGSHIAEELVRRGIETIVIDDLSTGSINNLTSLKESNLLRVYPKNVKQIEKLLPDEEDIDVIFHEAAIVSVPRSIKEPSVVHDVNVNATLDVMNFCVSHDVMRIVFASSAAVYGRIENPPATEETHCYPSSPYGATKLAVENYLEAYNQTYNLETVALRYFNVYGPRQKLSEYAGVITLFINHLLRKKSPVIFGDGSQSRDFAHVTDIVQANMLAMESQDAVGETFNVASGTSSTILELFEVLREVVGTPEIQPILAQPREGDVKVGAASIAKIKRLLGYEPRVPLREGLSELVAELRLEANENEVYAETRT
jgi:nucleoside-diphosphate-sugar epimerase